MGIGSGIGAQLGWAAEPAYGTTTTPTRFSDFDSESLHLEQQFTDPQGLAAGRLVPLASRRSQTSRGVTGSIGMDFATKAMGLLVKQMLGSSLTAPVQIAASTAYRQVHQYGNAGGQSLTFQVGKPQPDGTVKPFTYPGCKVTGWEFGSSVGEQVKLSLDIDAKDELTATALAVASYVAGAELFNHNQLSIKIGGTASTASGVVSVAGGTVATTLFNSASVKASNPMKTDRHGTSVTKSEPIQNGMLDASIELGGEFTSQAEFYDQFRADALIPVQLTWTGSALDGSNYLLDVIASACRFDPVTANVDGPDVLSQTVPLRIFADTVNNPLQITLVSSDTTL